MFSKGVVRTDDLYLANKKGIYAKAQLSYFYLDILLGNFTWNRLLEIDSLEYTDGESLERPNVFKKSGSN